MINQSTNHLVNRLITADHMFSALPALQGKLIIMFHDELRYKEQYTGIWISQNFYLFPKTYLFKYSQILHYPIYIQL